MAARRKGPQPERRLIVVSNRLPVTLRRGKHGTERVHSTGGLVAALEPTVERRGGVWIGWPGMELRRGETVSDPADAYRIEPVPLSRSDVRRYYYGFSNRTLWPLFHTMPGRAVFHSRDWHTYREVNERFAEITHRELASGDVVWVNDYQLMMTPGDLRSRASDAAIGFFLHIPFPPYDVFRLLPWAKRLIRGLLASDLIGFHVRGYVRNFLDAAHRLLGASIDRRSGIVQHPGGTSRVAAFPLGIDFDHFDALARQAAPQALDGEERVILGVDRLDYTKGIPHRIRAFGQLLEQHPEHRQNVSMVQVAVPSRSEVAEYRQLKREIDELVGRVNGQFGTAHWTPIRYLYRSVPQDRLAGMYRDADLALITPLRDGMNLVAKEFIACQVNDPGVLILSYMAGAAETMREAILVNPYNLEGTADAIHRALTMTAAERRQRLDALRRRERNTNVFAWAKRFLDALATTAARRGRR